MLNSKCRFPFSLVIMNAEHYHKEWKTKLKQQRCGSSGGMTNAESGSKVFPSKSNSKKKVGTVKDYERQK